MTDHGASTIDRSPQSVDYFGHWLSYYHAPSTGNRLKNWRPTVNDHNPQCRRMSKSRICKYQWSRLAVRIVKNINNFVPSSPSTSAENFNDLVIVLGIPFELAEYKKIYLEDYVKNAWKKLYEATIIKARELQKNGSVQIHLLHDLVQLLSAAKQRCKPHIVDLCCFVLPIIATDETMKILGSLDFFPILPQLKGFTTKADRIIEVENFGCMHVFMIIVYQIMLHLTAKENNFPAEVIPTVFDKLGDILIRVFDAVATHRPQSLRNAVSALAKSLKCMFLLISKEENIARSGRMFSFFERLVEILTEAHENEVPNDVAADGLLSQEWLVLFKLLAREKINHLNVKTMSMWKLYFNREIAKPSSSQTSLAPFTPPAPLKPLEVKVDELQPPHAKRAKISPEKRRGRLSVTFPVELFERVRRERMISSPLNAPQNFVASVSPNKNAAGDNLSLTSVENENDMNGNASKSSKVANTVEIGQTKHSGGSSHENTSLDTSQELDGGLKRNSAKLAEVPRRSNVSPEKAKRRSKTDSRRQGISDLSSYSKHTPPDVPDPLDKITPFRWYFDVDSPLIECPLAASQIHMRTLGSKKRKEEFLANLRAKKVNTLGELMNLSIFDVVKVFPLELHLNSPNAAVCIQKAFIRLEMEIRSDIRNSS
ncbi:unnamed protein product [Caenorhabditis auriculariae]|uniref:Uncharacterized protein n=1 Tax=Caenorhabditis auriculariae TaxID=2777116 RepID=A0A8S1HL76_9PELO|nr:unnamed protein product [Caenorhabditis auriculariae]